VTAGEEKSLQVIVAGGAGFLGSHLCERLLQGGRRVLCVDNLSTGNRRNIEHLDGDRNFRFLRHDITEPLSVDADEIYNLACPASPLHYQSDPVSTLETSVLGSIHLLGLARRTGARILQASTSEVYGDPEVHPQPESYTGNVSMVGPRACYDEGKRCAEALFYSYHAQHGVRIRVARLFNTYGPRMSPADGRVIANFVVQALSNRSITIYGDGRQTRSLCFVADLIDGLVRLMDLKSDRVGPVNIGSTAEITITELATLIVRLTNSKSRLVYQEGLQDDPRRRRPDTTKVHELLQWSASTPLELGLRKTIAYFDAQLSARTPDPSCTPACEVALG
jgi:UDP-glucuronate decarboxylase